MIKQKVVTTVIFAVVLTINSYGLFVLNNTEGAFNPHPCEDCINYASSDLGEMLVAGAEYFLQSNIDYQMFLKTIEISDIYGINNEDMANTIDNAIKHMKMANETYFQILQVSNLLEYNPTVQEKLKNFDYNNYQYVNRLNPAIFHQVEQLLKTGDVRGCYQRFYNATNKILMRLQNIKTSVDILTIPKIADCWRLNQLYLEMELFGQYTAEVCMNIK